MICRLYRGSVCTIGSQAVGDCPKDWNFQRHVTELLGNVRSPAFRLICDPIVFYLSLSSILTACRMSRKICTVHRGTEPTLLYIVYFRALPAFLPVPGFCPSDKTRLF